MSGISNGNAAVQPPKRHPIIYQPFNNMPASSSIVQTPPSTPNFNIALPTISQLVNRIGAGTSTPLPVNARSTSVIVNPQTMPTISQLAAHVNQTASLPASPKPKSASVPTIDIPAPTGPLDLTTTSLPRASLQNLDLFSTLLATPPSTSFQPASSSPLMTPLSTSPMTLLGQNQALAAPLITASSLASLLASTAQDPNSLLRALNLLSPAPPTASTPNVVEVPTKPSTPMPTAAASTNSSMCPLQLLAMAAEVDQKDDDDVICLGEHKSQPGDLKRRKTAPKMEGLEGQLLLMEMLVSTTSVIWSTFRTESPDVFPHVWIDKLLIALNTISNAKKTGTVLLLKLFQELHPELKDNKELMQKITESLNEADQPLDPLLALIEIDMEKFHTMRPLLSNLFKVSVYWDKAPKEFELMTILSSLIQSNVSFVPKGELPYDRTGLVFPGLNIGEWMMFLKMVVKCFLSVEQFFAKKPSESRKRKIDDAGSETLQPECKQPKTTAPLAAHPILQPVLSSWPFSLLGQAGSSSSGWPTVPMPPAAPVQKKQRRSPQVIVPMRLPDIPQTNVVPEIVPVPVARELLKQHVSLTQSERRLLKRFLNPRAVRLGSNAGHIAVELSRHSNVPPEKCIKFIWEEIHKK